MIDISSNMKSSRQKRLESKKRKAAAFLQIAEQLFQFPESPEK